MPYGLDRNEDKLYDFAAEKRHETDKATLIFDGEKEYWIPKSLLQDNNDGTYTVPEWWAIKSGLA